MAGIRQRLAAEPAMVGGLVTSVLWQGAMAAEVSHATLTVQEVFAKPPAPSQPRIIAAITRAAGRLRSSVTPARPATEGAT